MSCPNCDLAWRMLGMDAEKRLAIVMARHADGEGRLKTFAVGAMAKEAGLARETASRVLSEWHVRGWIGRRFGGVGVVLRAKLLELAKELARESAP